jgi:dolichyl-phosphate-mannose--protein O-mannosyl transferase
VQHFATLFFFVVVLPLFIFAFCFASRFHKVNYITSH